MTDESRAILSGLSLTDDDRATLAAHLEMADQERGQLRVAILGFLSGRHVRPGDSTWTIEDHLDRLYDAVGMPRPNRPAKPQVEAKSDGAFIPFRERTFMNRD